MKKKGKKGIIGIVASILAVMFLMGGSSFVNAAEVTVTTHNEVLYTTEKAVVYTLPDLQAQIVTAINANLPIEVTGITSNGWYRVSLQGTYYIPGYGLQAKPATTTKSNNVSDIKKLTSGTFSFFTYSQLRNFTQDDIADMNENTYIKYLDSYLMGKGMLEECILADSGLTLEEGYKKESEESNQTMKEYLLTYRNEYLEDSLLGPVRKEDDLKLVLNRAIRYDYEEFITVYKNAVVGSDETKMKEVLNDVIAKVKAEQGIDFTYKMEYHEKADESKQIKAGWEIKFTRKQNSK